MASHSRSRTGCLVAPCWVLLCWLEKWILGLCSASVAPLPLPLHLPICLSLLLRTPSLLSASWPLAAHSSHSRRKTDLWPS